FRRTVFNLLGCICTVKDSICYDLYQKNKVVTWCPKFFLLEKKSFSCVSVPNCHATRRLHEGRDTARLPKPRQGKSKGRGRVRTTDLSLCWNNFPGINKYIHLQSVWFCERLTWNPAESLVCDVSRQPNVLHQGASCSSCYDVPHIVIHVSEPLVCDVSGQLNVLHQAASCVSCFDIRNIAIHATMKMFSLGQSMQL
ncbi:hypothetical protein CSKR_100655, partial [Clonorchis sinensis]